MADLMNNLPKDTYGLVKTIFKILIRIAIALVVGLIGFYLMFISTMGPSYAPNVWDGRWDMVIRLSELVLGAGIIMATLVWLVWPLLRWLYQNILNV